MISRIQTQNYRSLRSIDQRLRSFQALVGPNGSGKSTFLDVINYLSDLMSFRGDVEEASRKRSANFADLTWNREGTSFQFAIESPIPEKLHEQLSDDCKAYDRVRYEIEVGLEAGTGPVGVQGELLWFVSPEKKVQGLTQGEIVFPSAVQSSSSLLTPESSRKGRKPIIIKKADGNDVYYFEKEKTRSFVFPVGKSRSALANLPGAGENFPVSSWFREMLLDGVQSFVLNSEKIRKPSPPNQAHQYSTDGGNLPWAVENLRISTPVSFARWLSHIKTAIADIADIRTIERAEDKHRYLMIKYDTGIEVPSWMVSDGTLRLLALTLPAYLPEQDGLLLIEEPENGVHPKAMEPVFQSLSSIYGAQTLMATHSPIALSLLNPRDILCFAKSASGATDTTTGDCHPALLDWKRGTLDLGLVFAAGILG
ncbi:MAG: methylation-associated defense system AAA family ATPase MAD3 [Prosthecobacter sp.]|uniref:methylation-associated defense system AAA family ATPase MAD3 n=1 Tax=Prosthecobacter sp. TaxID=1965333 RepID=UPI003902EB28